MAEVRVCNKKEKEKRKKKEKKRKKENVITVARDANPKDNYPSP